MLCIDVVPVFHTGSNSVNVFLGLGLPWVLKTMHALAYGYTFKVKTDNLTQGVVIFGVAGTICIITLLIRRKVRASVPFLFYFFFCPAALPSSSPPPPTFPVFVVLIVTCYVLPLAVGYCGRRN